ncbi:MAG: hypothetical protein QM811_05910 [Pirellulales bacterium]
MSRAYFRFYFTRFSAICGLCIGLGAVTAQAAFVQPSDATGTFGQDFYGVDPVAYSAWSAYPTNSLAFATSPTIRSIPLWNRPTDLSSATSGHTTYQEWDVFDANVLTATGTAPNTPPSGNNAAPLVEAAPLNPAGVARTFSTDGVSFLTGGGNVYSFSGTTQMTMIVPNYALGAGFDTHYLLQIRSLGTPLDLTNFKINGIDVTTLGATFQELYNQALGGFGGNSIDLKVEFTLPGNRLLDTITWSGAGSSSSQDRVSLDTYAVAAVAVPEPGSIALWVSAGILGGICLFRKRFV